MGADFLFDCIIIKDSKTDSIVRTQLLAKCETLTLADFTELDKGRILDTFGIELTKDTLKDFIIQSKRIIEDTFKALDCRECSYMTFKGYKIHLTGGMSWGDAPTDAFDTFGKFNALPACLHKILG